MTDKAKPPSPTKRRRATLLTLGSLFVLGIVVGHYAGRALSPVYDSSPEAQLAVRDYIALAARPHSEVDVKKYPGISPNNDEATATHIDYRGFRDSQGRLARISPFPDSIIYPCGVTLYKFDLASQTLTKSAAGRFNRAALHRLPLNRIAFFDALDFAVGGLQGYHLRTSLPPYLRYVRQAKTGEGAARRVVAGVVSFLSGVGVGLYFGYSNDFSCSAPPVAALLEDPSFWIGVEPGVSERFTWYIRYRPDGAPELDRARGAMRYRAEQRGDYPEALVRAGNVDQLDDHLIYLDWRN
ncbi:MAG TPA: hypothetical protein VEW48_05960 [Thermoanaerobaculia bacterium]|nr:hypothetical protein [Thermoanaerobaculia bacterium]